MNQEPQNYKFKTSSKPGKHSIPAVIEYTDDDGRWQKITKDIKYNEINYWVIQSVRS